MSHRKSNMLTELKRQIENEILQIERRQDLSVNGQYKICINGHEK